MHFNQKDKKNVFPHQPKVPFSIKTMKKYWKLKFHFKYNCANNLSIISSNHLKTSKVSSWQQFLVPMCLQTKAISYRSVRLAYTKTYDNTSDLVFDSYYSRSPRPNTWYSIDPVFEPPSIDHHRMICLWLESWMSIGDRIYKLNQTSRPDISQETEQCTKDDRGLQTEDWQTSTMKQYWGNLIWQS